jgi:hypothetical protein
MPTEIPWATKDSSANEAKHKAVVPAKVQVSQYESKVSIQSGLATKKTFGLPSVAAAMRNVAIHQHKNHGYLIYPTQMFYLAEEAESTSTQATRYYG